MKITLLLSSAWNLLIIPLATSGSSGMGNTNRELAVSCPGAELKEGKRFPADASAEELKAWAEEFGI